MIGRLALQYMTAVWRPGWLSHGDAERAQRHASVRMRIVGTGPLLHGRNRLPGVAKLLLDLCLRHNVDASVFLPAGFVVLLPRRLFLAVTDRGQLIARNSHLHQVILSRLRPLLSQRHVVFRRPAFVAVAFHRQLVVRVILQNVAQFGRIRLQRLDRIGTQRVLVVVEIGVFDSRQQRIDPRACHRVRQPLRLPNAVTRARIDTLLARIEDAYFDYDKHTLRPDAIQALQADSTELRDILKDYPDYKLTVEGHCDERGSAEYNMALGQERAQAAKDYLVQVGIPSDQLATISYGKEKPACEEHDEDCWQKNRRIHIVAQAQAQK